MTRSVLHPPKVVLRLAREDAKAEVAPAATIRDVGLENRMAALAADDVRAAFASAVAGRLEGGRAAILRPEARRALMTSSAKLGLRAFDASLVIAIVQDAARRGEGVASGPVEARLGMVGEAEPETLRVWPLAAGVVLGLLMLAAMVWMVA